MIIGCVKEVKNNEYRVGLTPDAVKSFTAFSHTVYLEKGAGLGSGYTDDEYKKAGAKILNKAEEVWNKSEMIIKVKEPVESEYKYFRENLLIYTYFHLAADKPLTKALLKDKVTSVAYETIVGKNGGLPCLIPMSEIAGRLSIQEGAKYLEKTFGGKGVLLAGVPGVHKGNVVIIGGGTVGTNACKMAYGLGANVTILDVNGDRLTQLDDLFDGKVTTLFSTRENIQKSIAKADLVVGAVLIPGKKAPKLVLKEDLKLMKPGTVMVDVAIDQGGCFETSKPTTHEDPIYIKDGIVHYCVTNMPGAVSRTSTDALVARTLPYGLDLANKGMVQAVQDDYGLSLGVNTYKGKITFEGVAEAFNMSYTPLEELL